MAAAPRTDVPALVVFSGEYDLASKDQLQPVFAFLEQAAPAVMDFSAVTYIDSTVLRAMALLHQARVQSGRDRPVLILKNPTVRRVLEIASMTEIFRIVETREEAVGNDPDSFVVRHAATFDGHIP